MPYGPATGSPRRRPARAKPSTTASPSAPAGSGGTLSADSPPSGGVGPAAGEPGDEGGGLPGWVSVLAIGGLLTAAAAVAAIRARRVSS